MIYDSAREWQEAPHKQVLLFGMSGLGKTHISNMLRAGGDWFHYSVDYRIGTRYMGEHIADNFKREAMKNPFLRDLLRSDSINIASNISFDNLTPVSSYLGKPGDPAKGGLEFGEYSHRQAQFRRAEIAALSDTEQFIARAQEIYDYKHFVCDTGGSICEWVDPQDPADPVLTALARQTLMIWIEGSDAHTEELARRFDKAPKPMSYQPEFLEECWNAFLAESNVTPRAVDPDAFIRWTYGRAMAHRQPRYRAIAEGWGVTLSADDVAAVQTPGDFEALVARALEAR